MNTLSVFFCWREISLFILKSGLKLRQISQEFLNSSSQLYRSYLLKSNGVIPTTGMAATLTVNANVSLQDGIQT